MKCTTVLLVCHFILSTYSETGHNSKHSDGLLPEDQSVLAAQQGTDLKRFVDGDPQTQGISMIEKILPSDQESDIDDITTCSPYINLFDQKRVTISRYIYIKNNNRECLDTTLNLVLDGSESKPSKFLTQVLSRDDKKSDTVLCREFVELFKLVDLAGLTQRMCDERVLADVSRVPFCTSPLPSKVDLSSLVGTFTKENLFKIAAAFNFLIQLHGTEDDCGRVCGGDDNAFCNAFVNLTLFFMKQSQTEQPASETKSVTLPPVSKVSNRSLLRAVKASLFQPRITLEELRDIQGSLDSPSQLKRTIQRIFPFMSDRHLSVIKDNLEIVRFVVNKAIARKELHTLKNRTFSPPTESSFNRDLEDRLKDSFSRFNELDMWATTEPTRKPLFRPRLRVPIRPITKDMDWIWSTRKVPERNYEWTKSPTDWRLAKERAGKNLESSQRVRSGASSSAVWRMFKIFVISGFVISSVYFCIRYKKRIRDLASPYLARFQ